MFSLLLAMIYLAFISLGLPDSLLGSAWPVMFPQLHVPISYAGVITFIIAGGTIVSSLLSDRLTRRFGAGTVTACSVLLTAVALLGFSVSRSFALLCVLALPYGLGAGAVDAALNNYVALHFAPRHMSWLHACWGIGASISPYIMSSALASEAGWSGGYHTVGLLQIALATLLFVSLPLWKKHESEQPLSQSTPKSLRYMLGIKGVPLVLITFFAYCALESVTGVWAASYLVIHRHVSTELAARFASYYYIGITVGRLFSGFITEKLGDKRMIRYGLLLILVGIALVWLPVDILAVPLAGLVVIGLGCAPIYPCIIHATPARFGADNSQAIIGLQMASAYTGITLMPLCFGWLADTFTMGLYAPLLLLLTLIMLAGSERTNALH